MTRIMMAARQDGVVIHLAAHPDHGASRVMAQLRTAPRTCRAFPAAGARDVAWTGVRPAHQLGEGDQEVAFRGEVHIGPAKDDPMCRTRCTSSA
ncbi:hypothetical protein ACWFRM_40155 [Streptomyces sp. NPDC055144]